MMPAEILDRVWVLKPRTASVVRNEIWASIALISATSKPAAWADWIAETWVLESALKSPESMP